MSDRGEDAEVVEIRPKVVDHVGEYSAALVKLNQRSGLNAAQKIRALFGSIAMVYINEFGQPPSRLQLQLLFNDALAVMEKWGLVR